MQKNKRPTFLIANILNSVIFKSLENIQLHLGNKPFFKVEGEKQN